MDKKTPDDPFTFTEFMRENYADIYEFITDSFFQRAVDLAEEGYLLSAVNDAELARQMVHYTGDDYPVIYVYGFLTEASIEAGNIKQAQLYCDLALRMLDANDEDYARDLENFRQLRELSCLPVLVVLMSDPQCRKAVPVGGNPLTYVGWIVYGCKEEDRKARL